MNRDAYYLLEAKWKRDWDNETAAIKFVYDCWYQWNSKLHYIGFLLVLKSKEVTENIYVYI